MLAVQLHILSADQLWCCKRIPKPFLVLQRLRPPEDPASVDYIQRLKASEGTAFVSSTQEWKRRMLSPAAAPHLANAMPPATVSHACGRTPSTRGPVCNCIAVVVMSRSTNQPGAPCDEADTGFVPHIRSACHTGRHPRRAPHHMVVAQARQAAMPSRYQAPL
jgi:hypothetical protein